MLGLEVHIGRARDEVMVELDMLELLLLILAHEVDEHVPEPLELGLAFEHVFFLFLDFLEALFSGFRL